MLINKQIRKRKRHKNIEQKKKECSFVQINTGDNETSDHLELNLLQLFIDKTIFILFYYVACVDG
jgi:hypothetical protein